jgi:hypothetical protein
MSRSNVSEENMNTVIITENTDASWTDRASERPTMPAAPSLPPESGETDDPDALGRVMYGCYLESDYPAALALAERVIHQKPTHALAHVVADRCRSVLASERSTRLESHSVLRISSTPSRLSSLPLDPMSLFLLGQIDGRTTAEDIVSIVGSPASETLDRLWDLMALGVVEIV